MRWLNLDKTKHRTLKWMGFRVHFISSSAFFKWLQYWKVDLFGVSYDNQLGKTAFKKPQQNMSGLKFSWLGISKVFRRTFQQTPGAYPKPPTNSLCMFRNSFHLGGERGCLGYAPRVCWGSLPISLIHMESSQMGRTPFLDLRRNSMRMDGRLMVIWWWFMVVWWWFIMV